MATQHGAVGIDGAKIALVEGGLITEHVSLSTPIVTYRTLNATGTQDMSFTVPRDGAELLSMAFTVVSTGSVGTSGTNQWSISDGTNALATMAAATAVAAKGTVTQLVMGSATNGKNIATTTGARLVLTNTEAGTIIEGPSGTFTCLWAL